jgi:uncharacterized protein (DUF1697 family)
MPICVALLRGINVGGRNLIAMSDLRDLLESLGFTKVRSLLQSGNLVFLSNRRTSATIERLLEVETEKRLGVSVDYHVRTAEEWKSVIARNPFAEEAERDPAHLVVLFLKSVPDAKNVQALQAAIRGPEIVRADGKQVYVVYPLGIGTSKLTNALIDKKLGMSGTGRNWNTVLKLAALAQQ